MNRIFILFMLTFMALCGCKARKQVRTIDRVERQAEERIEGRTSWMQMIGRDSTSRYWTFTSDSSFYFHPAAGLWAGSGQIAYGEQRVIQQQAAGVEHSYDSSSMDSSKVERRTDSKTSGTPSLGRVWLLLIVPVLLLIYWRWWKK